MEKRSTFYSSYGDAFWDQNDARVRDAVADVLEKDCKKGIVAGISFVILMLIAFAWGLITLINGEIMDDFRMVLMLIFPPICIPPFISAVIRTRRYQVKGRQGMFRVAHVRILNRSMSRGMTRNTFNVDVVSTTADATATIEVEKNFYDKAGVGMRGWLSMVEDETNGLLASPYWFIGDTDPKAAAIPAPTVGTSPVETPAATVYAEARVSNARPEDLAAAYFQAHLKDVILSAVSAVLFFLGGLWLVVGSALDLDRSMFAALFMVPFLVLLMVCLVVQTPVHMRESHEGRKISTLYMFLQFFPNMFLAFLLISGGTGVRLLVSVSLLIFNLLMVFLLNKGLIDTYRDLKNGRYSAMSAVLMSRNQTSRYVYPFFVIKLCTCVVEVGSSTYEVKITPSQYKDYFDGMTGTMVTLEKNGTNLFLRA